jgi:collagenase-like PrtC family protease
MNLSVAYNFEPGFIESLSTIPEVKDIYGKMTTDHIGGGRSNYTFRRVNYKMLSEMVDKAHRNGIQFNYLLNASSLFGIEQTRFGQKQIRKHLDLLMDANVDSITVASPYLLRLIKNQYPHFQVKAGAFAVIDSPQKARQWEELGADSLCISAIACNRNFGLLKEIRAAVSCDLMLIVNANCLQSCSYELTHMNLLSNSSRKGDPNNGFCLDYCILHCTHRRFKDPVNFIRSTWIRPEDLSMYESIGYTTFKIVERSCPSELLLKRVKAYVKRTFDGNLLELVGPVASIKKELNADFFQRLKMILTMFKPHMVNIPSLWLMKKFGEHIIIHDYTKGKSGIYIDNKSLDGFLKGLAENNCSSKICQQCGYCASWALKTVEINKEYRSSGLKMAEKLEEGMLDGNHWF